MDYDKQLIKNVIDEINRLNAQLVDLEKYKDDFSQDEIDSMKKETLEHLINNTKMLEKMQSGHLTTKTELEEARIKINSIIYENYNVKDLLSSYLSGEVQFLREKLNSVIRYHALNKIDTDEYSYSVSQLLEAIGKNTQLNEEEKKLSDSLKNKVMNKYEVDQGIDKNKIEKTFMNK